MNYRKLGKSDLLVSEISFGCMSLKPESRENDTILKRAIEMGINYFDTADLYDQGENERLLGKALKHDRQKIYIGTKVGNQWRADGSGWDWNPRKDYIIQAVDHSLQRLQTEYIDLYQLHGGTIDDPMDDTIEAFELLVSQGKIRYYGISSIRPNVIREYASRSNIVSVMMQYSLLDRRPEESCFPLLEKNNIGVLSRGSLAKGLLVDKKATDYLGQGSKTVETVQTEVSKMANSGRNSAQVALKFALGQTAVSSAVTGFRTLHQLDNVLNGIDTALLTEEELNTLKVTAPATLYDNHR